MPQVPRVSQNSVQERALGGADFSFQIDPNAFGAGRVAQQTEATTQAAIDQGQQRIVKENLDADRLAVLDAQNRTLNYKNDLFFNPETGAVTKKGKDAFGIVDQYGEDFQKYTQDIENSLATETQKKLYQEVRAKESLDLTNNLQRHLYTQAQEYDKETLEGGLKALDNDSTLNYSTPGKVRANLDQKRQLLESFAERNGIPVDSDQFKVMLTEQTSQTHVAVLGRMANNRQDQAARAYFEKAKPELTSRDLIHVEGVLKEASTLGEAQRATATIFAQHSTSITEALEKARTISNPEVQERAVNLLKERFQEQSVQQQAAQSAQYDDVLKSIEKGVRYDALPITLINSMSPEHREKARQIDQQLNVDRKQVEPYGDTFMNLQTQMVTDPDKVRAMNPNDYKYQVSPKEFDKIQQFVADKGGGTYTIKDSFPLQYQYANEVLKQLNVPTEAKIGTPELSALNRLHAEIDKSVKQFEAANGAPPKPEEIRSIIDNFIIEGTVTKERGMIGSLLKGHTYEEPVRAFQAAPSDNFQVKVEKIPPTFLKRIRQDFAAKGNFNPSEKAIQQYYREYLNGLGR